jgi:hypothetical protein
VIDFHVRQNAMLLEDPVDLLLLAPDDVPVVVPGLLPLSIDKPIVDAVFKSGFEFYTAAESSINYGGVG